MIQGKFYSFSYPSQSSSSRDLIPSTSNVSGSSSWREESGLQLDNSGSREYEMNGSRGILFMDPSLRQGDTEDERGDCSIVFEKEHMFDKVVTPSDVGKLNRLVIPKQHAEKYFPLDSSNCEKSLLLNFEDRDGKLWRFRYSYWNSSQSYVMTKGWSRFVKEMKLDAGDIVLFQRGVCELGKDRLFIDWRRRRHHQPEPPPLAHNHLHFLPRQVSFGRSVAWDSPAPHNYQWFSQTSNGSHIPHRNSFSGAIRPSYGYQYGYGDTAMSLSRSNFGIYDRFSISSNGATPHTTRGDVDTRGNCRERAAQPSVEIYESVPVGQVKAPSRARKFRLFGVNMECEANESNIDDNLQPPSPPDLMLYDGVPMTSMTRIASKGKGSLSLDLDI